MTKCESYVAAVLFLAFVFFCSFITTQHQQQADVKKQQDEITLKNHAEELEWQLAEAQAVRDLWRAAAERKQ